MIVKILVISTLLPIATSAVMCSIEIAANWGCDIYEGLKNKYNNSSKEDQ